MSSRRGVTLNQVIMGGAGLLLTALPGASAAALPNPGASLFKAHCGMCHADPHNPAAAAQIGPPLIGIAGSKAAANRDYKRYSSALRKARIVWTEPALAAYLAAPAAFVPGTTMALVGVMDSTERSSLIAYLKSASAH